MKEEVSEDIKLKFELNQETDIINCHIKEKLKNMFNVYCRIKKIEENSVYILYDGKTINNFEYTLDKIANKISKEIKEISFLVIHRPKSVIITFSHLNDSYKEKTNIEENLERVFSDYLSKNKIDRKNVILRYNNQIVDSKMTINQFITKHNINLGNMDLENDNKLFEIKIDVIDIHEVYHISFSHQKIKKKYLYALEKNMGDIFNDYTSKNKIDKNKVEFKYKGIPIKQNQSLDEFIKENINNKNNQNETLYNMNPNEMKENEKIINIDVIDLSCPSYLFRTYKLIIFIIIGIIVIVGVTVLIVLLLKKHDNNNTSPIKNNIIIPYDYFINATYFSDKSETVKLISDEYDLNKIKRMSIDGKVINPIKSYNFTENGDHIVYYSFNNISDIPSFSEGRYIFNGISKLKYIKFSDYSENHPDVSFQGMFNNCINLLSVDFSQMKPNDNFYGTDIYDYYYSMDYMFNNCRSLTSINFEIKKEGSNIISIMSSKYMFNNCTSLTNLYLSKIKFYKNLNNMFSNCTSLETVILSNFDYSGDDLNMSYMFYNCTSLVSLIFPSENMNIPYDMSYSFAYCSSLKKLELEFDDDYYNYYYYYYYYNNNTNTMKSAFRNCTSLVSITLKFELLYEDMSYLFMGCSSLESISSDYFISGYFPFTKYMNGMFIDCFSFSGFSLDIKFYSEELRDISYMFSGSSITFVDFSNVETNYITNYEGLFYDCEYLSYVDLSSFTHNNLPDSNLSIFKGNYPTFPTLVINEKFLNRIEVPSNFEIRIFTINNTYGNSTDFYIF